MGTRMNFAVFYYSLMQSASGLRMVENQMGRKIMDTIVPNVSKPSKMFFLFMADDGFPDSVHELWQTFFQNHERGVHYEAILHCKNADVCLKKGYGAFADVIDTVDSTYCEDLVSPMLALLETAVGSKYLSRGPEIAGPENDTFIFLSETTVPVKSFQRMQSIFLDDQGRSSMCVAAWETGKHAHVPSMDAIIVKHSQWITLTRHHANLALYKRKEIPIGKIWAGGQGCVDEYWFFLAIFGTLTLQSKTATDFQSSLSKLNGLNSGCYTFVDFSRRHITNNAIAHGERVPYAPIDSSHGKKRHPVWYTTPELTKEKHIDTHPDYGPDHLDLLTLQALQEWNASPLAFIRKVDDSTRIQENMTLSEIFDAAIFGPNPQSTVMDNSY
eukprot:gnl/MRDRNA2_/MRDRNA2_86693_c0_seq1.p1 gnl/MRDRNA2_/MRDRNA2_86693_c0~~gnl/MRDRNA2_/MRDRNA2_86693_c0_seq1.p1  ORF type:complete len:385 (+),score=35.22 gnl/MRDRNA2_/MRDRNA2_86693_c0_seq1:87-1241(+)